MLTREKLIAEYLDYINNYLTIEKFAEHRGLTTEEGQLLYTLAKKCYNDKHPEA